VRLGRHVEGAVDACFGPAELAEQVKAEEPAGVELCRAFHERKGFRGLLTERVRVRDLLEAKG
jgi:hypothetical protein